MPAISTESPIASVDALESRADAERVTVRRLLACDAVRHLSAYLRTGDAEAALAGYAHMNAIGLQTSHFRAMGPNGAQAAIDHLERWGYTS